MAQRRFGYRAVSASPEPRRVNSAAPWWREIDGLRVFWSWPGGLTLHQDDSERTRLTSVEGASESGGPSSATSPSDVETRPLEASASPPPVDPLRQPWLDVGHNLGRYLIIGECGRGGMGVVVRAYDPKLQREVALKVLWRERDDPDGRARIIREARALARLSHPNVVSVYDVELEDTRGHTVVAMEFVPGSTLRKWLDRGPSQSEIIDAFVQAGRGLQAAHEAGLLHRDFKPSNVLRTERGTLKVTDFGLAKAVGGGPPSPQSASASASMPILPEPDLVTRADTVVGTPRDMAPEQLLGKSLSPAVDQYAYCVALWEALTGTPPFAARKHAELIQTKLAGPPAWPESASAPSRIADALIRGLDPNPDRRWPSMSELLQALQSEQRRGPGRWWMVLGAGGITAAAVAWGMNQTPADERCTGARARVDEAWSAERRTQVGEAFTATELPYAEESLERTLAALDEYADAWAEQHTRACEATTVRGEQSSAILDLRMACLQRRWQSLEATTKELAQADGVVVENAASMLDALPRLSPCTDVDALLRDVVPPAPEQAAEVERIGRAMAPALARLSAGHYEQAVTALEPLEAEAAELGYGPLHSELKFNLGEALVRMGKPEQGRVVLADALTLALGNRRWAEARDVSLKLAWVVGNDLSKTSEGRAYAHTARGLLEVAADPLVHADLQRGLAVMARTDGRLDEAEALLRNALERAQSHPDSTIAIRTILQGDLGNVLQDRGDYANAERAYRESLTLTRNRLGPRHPRVARGHANLGRVLENRGRYEAAEREVRQALSITVDILGDRHPDLITIRTNLGNALYLQGKLSEAEAEHREALSIALENYELTHPRVAFVRNNLALVLSPQGRHEDAREQLRTAIDAWMSANEPGHPYVAALHYNLGLAWSADEHHAEAETEYRSALGLGEKALGADHPKLLSVRADLAATLLARDKDLEEARTLVEAAWTKAETVELPDEERGKIAWVLAQLRARDEAELAGALDLARAARQLLKQAGEAHTPMRTAVEAWLAEHEPG